MPCQRWKEEWVAYLYDEMPPEEREIVREHLATCDGCRRTMDGLEQSGRALRAAAPPVPEAPRVLVLPARWNWRQTWTFAAGVAAATAFFLLGLAITSGGSPGRFSPDPGPSLADGGASREELAALVVSLEARLERLEQADSPAAGRIGADALTRAQFDNEIDQLARRFDDARRQDLEYLLQTMSQSEIRTGAWIDQTQKTLTYLTLRQDPRMSEH